MHRELANTISVCENVLKDSDLINQKEDKKIKDPFKQKLRMQLNKIRINNAIQWEVVQSGQFVSQGAQEYQRKTTKYLNNCKLTNFNQNIEEDKKFLCCFKQSKMQEKFSTMDISNPEKIINEEVTIV